MYIKVFGLPAHPLLVHATAVVVPLAALVVVAAAWWPALRRWAGLLPLGLSVVAFGLVPLTTHTGEQLRARLPASTPIERHAEMADGLLPWVFGLVLVATALAWLDGPLPALLRRFGAAPRPGAHAGAPAVRAEAPGTARDAPGHTGTRRRATSRSSGLRVAAAALAVLAAGGTIVQVVRIGDSGAKATWSQTPSAPRADAG